MYTKPSSNLSDSVFHQFAAAGISVLPVAVNFSKEPASPALPKDDEGKSTWKPYQKQIATTDKLNRWAAAGWAIGSIGGAVSGGLEWLDFDDGNLFEPFYQKTYRIVAKCPVIETPSDGKHIGYRCDEYGGNVKIAMDPKAEKQTLIETRGEGGFVVSPGSPSGTHALGPYVQVSGPPLPEIPRITPDERRQLWAAARSFDKRQPKQPKRARFAAADTEVHPVVAAFNERMSWDDILCPLGWSTRDNVHWTRSGKTFGTSAVVVIGSDQSELLTVFSGNAGELSPEGLHRTWNKFAAWAKTKHRGEWKSAIREAADMLGGAL